MENNNENITLNLNGNCLKLGKDGRWQLEASELDLALLEIEKLVREKEELSKALEKTLDQVELFQKEISEINQAKSVMLEMVRSFSFFFSYFFTN
jgi:exosome complex RNA-binding protein Rrp4